MSYGHGSPKRLRFIVDRLSGYASQRITQPHAPLRYREGSQGFSPALQVAILRGEALLTQRFFAWCQRLPLGLLRDPRNALAIYQHTLHNPSKVADLAQRIGLVQAVATQTALPQSEAPQPNTRLAYQLYCGLVDDLDQTGQTQLLEVATDRFFALCLRGFFPSRTSTSSRKGLEALQQSAYAALSKALQQPFELKESFKEIGPEAELEPHVDFHFRLKYGGQWFCLPAQQAKRLKPARLKSYEALILWCKQGQLEAHLEPEMSSL